MRKTLVAVILAGLTFFTAHAQDAPCGRAQAIPNSMRILVYGLNGK